MVEHRACARADAHGMPASQNVPPQNPASSPAAATKSSPSSKSKQKSQDDFVSCFGEAGEATVTAIASGTTEIANAVAECGERLDADATAFLGAWSAKFAEGDQPVKTNRNKLKAVSLSSESKAKLAQVSQSAATWQLVRIIAATAAADQSAAAQDFLLHPAFARSLALLVDPEHEDLAKVLRVARLMIAERGAVIDRAADLAAAITVVHDTPVVMQVNESIAQGCGPIPTFDHFVLNERKMLFGLKGIAPELLVYVVDIATSRDDMMWSLRTFGGNRSVGDLYNKIEYDFDHLEKGKPKKVTVAGWNLQNILRVGGVCADQAYFASTVGKSIGVPCVYTTATDGVLSHAWIGFVSKAKYGPTWEEVGRFGGYQSVEGFVRDPQTGQQISNTKMPMLVQYGLEPAVDRASATALRIAAGRLLVSIKKGTAASVQPPAQPPAQPSAQPPAQPSVQPPAQPLAQPPAQPPAPAHTIEQVLALARIAVQACLTDARSWEIVAHAAERGAMTSEQKTQWSSDILTLCGNSYPEFAWRMISPMISSISDIAQRQQALDGALALFSTRGDLAGQILLQQATLYRSQNNALGAGRCYEIILNNYPNDGPFAIVALQEASEILAQNDNAAANLALHERAFRAMEVPTGIAPTFARQSNWYRSGVMLAQALRIVGRERDAQFHEQRMTDVMK